jgi:hypothetical protein
MRTLSPRRLLAHALIGIAVLLAAVPATAQAPAQAPTQAPTTVKVGMFINQLYDFDMAKRSYNVTFWAWFLHNNEAYKPQDNIEIVNSKSAVVRYPSLDTSKGVRFEQAKYFATMMEDWNITGFPFDRQQLHILLEDAQSEVGQVRLVADTENSRIDKAVTVPGWTVESFDVRSEDVTYDTTYGDPTLQGSSTYSRVVGVVTLKRDGLRLLFSTFIGFGVAFLLVMLTFLLEYESMAGPRVGLCAAAVFASVGNKYIVDNLLPPASTFTLADVIEATAFLSIILAALTVVGIQILRPRSARAAHLFNVAMGLLTLAGFFGANGYAIATAAAS